MKTDDIVKLLGEEKANYLLGHTSKTFSKEQLYLRERFRGELLERQQ